MPKFIDLTGQRFGRLLVIDRAENKIYGRSSRTAWRCKCDCGNEIVTVSESLRQGVSNSCGCLNEELSTSRIVAVNKKHGGRKDRLYSIWHDMKNRVENPNSHAYKNYGGRGITVCDEWKNDYAAFREWAYSNGYDKDAPRGQCTLDRIDVNGNYCPENCRWTTMYHQIHNRRNSKNKEA